MKVQIYSQWMEDVYIPVRVKQFTKAAKLLGYNGFQSYAVDQDMVNLVQPSQKLTEREVVAKWLDNRADEFVAESVA